MDPKITTNPMGSAGKGKSSEWRAECIEPLYCLFTCASCKKINTVRLNARFTVQRSTKADALAEMERLRQENVNALKAPGLKDGAALRGAECACRCAYCGEAPVWVTAPQKGWKKENRAGWISVLAAFVPIGYLMLFSPGNHIIERAGKLGYTALSILLLTISAAAYMMYVKRMWEGVDRKIENATRERPPLFGDTPEDVVRQAKERGAYAESDVRADMVWTDQTGEKSPV